MKCEINCILVFSSNYNLQIFFFKIYMYNFILCHWLLHVVVVLSHLYAAKVIVAVYDYLWNIMIIVMVRQSRNVLIRRSDGFIECTYYAYRLKQRKYFCPLKTLKYVKYCRPIVLSSFGIFLPTQDIGLFELKCYFYDFNIP